MSDYRIAIRPDVRGDDPMNYATLLDDIVVNHVPMFRAEQMSPESWWVCCYLNDKGDRIAWHVEAKGRPRRIEWTTVEFPDGRVKYEHEVDAAKGRDR